ncbi:amidase [Epidermidibacterium keratini]|uniref:Amidase n=1 Tax=Epidermidibacterium keratini TaxID=1891644 RepID=A0A7L4YJ60_9ACTN|nr:amidase [Epidermidibacterium keratini]QHB99340.1 amidase [Epidermidibacterium keratini]
MSAESNVVLALDVVRARDPEIHAFVATRDQAIEDARAVDLRASDLPLAGLPIAVKDIYDVAGMPTRCGSEVTPPEPATQSAACVQRLEELGAVVIGKTVTTEFAYFTPGPTHNPAAPGHTPGGSSSGSAAAVAAEMVPLAVGSQTAGSTTRPASFCGVAGMVFAQGSVDLRGQRPLAPSLDCLGLFAATVADLQRYVSAYSDLPPGTAAQRVLVWTPAEDSVDPQMTAAVARAAEIFRSNGLSVEPLHADRDLAILTRDHALVLAYEARRALGSVYDAHRSRLGTALVELLDAGGRITAADYEKALARRADLREKFARLLGPDTVVLGPAALGPPPAGLDSTGSPALSRPWHQLGLPVVCVPGARTDDGRPLGVQLIGRAGDEAMLLETGVSLGVGLTRG